MTRQGGQIEWIFQQGGVQINTCFHHETDRHGIGGDKSLIWLNLFMCWLETREEKAEKNRPLYPL